MIQAIPKTVKELEQRAGERMNECGCFNMQGSTRAGLRGFAITTIVDELGGI
jgi:hypothetical protein